MDTQPLPESLLLEIAFQTNRRNTGHTAKDDQTDIVPF
jgi:hypothetical protein